MTGLNFLILDPELWQVKEDRIMMLPVEEIMVSVVFKISKGERVFYFFQLQALPLFAPCVKGDYDLLKINIIDQGRDRFYIGRKLDQLQSTSQTIKNVVEPMLKPLTTHEGLLEFLASDQMDHNRLKAVVMSFFILLRMRRYDEALAFLYGEYWSRFRLNVEEFRRSEDRIWDYPKMKVAQRCQHEEMLFYEILLREKKYDRISEILEALKVRNVFRFYLNRYHRLI
jgi:hypothetical protein